MAVAPTSVGDALRARRIALGITQRVVADQAGLTTGFISQVERGLTAPSLSSLHAISKVLGLSPLQFIDTPPAPQQLTRAGARQTYGIAPNVARYERLTGHFPGSVLRSVICHEDPGQRHAPIRHEGEELFYIIAGALTVEVGGTPHVLHPGDTIHFSSGDVHSTWNHTSSPTTFLHTCTMDVFDDAQAVETTKEISA
ncbi:probable transcriptional regulator (plasmid) [Ketogulonicigenium vulgare Y25]|nr:cupin domain-containing protein [Ketogulonicigenium vulgare]ADO44271.1 probable transcriptional regulator [Ketogulonicigenium vulgare Y25]